MVDLRLGGNDFSGSVLPDFIFDFTDLQTLRLHDANFTGTIPATISGLTGLKELWLEDNGLSGALPDLSAASELAILRLTGNQFTGQIPAYLETLSNLVDLRLGRNLLTGSIPEFIGNMGQLQLFACQENQLTGGFPEFLTNLVNLGECFFVHRCSMQRHCILNCKFFSNLVVLDIAENPLGGTIPDSIGNLAAVCKFFLYYCIILRLARNSHCISN